MNSRMMLGITALLALNILGQDADAQLVRFKHNKGYNNVSVPYGGNKKQVWPSVSYNWNSRQNRWNGNQNTWNGNRPKKRIWPYVPQWNVNPLLKPAYKPNYVGNYGGAFRWRLHGCGTVGWYTGFAACDRVFYRAVYPGVDLSYNGGYNFIVSPGADPYQIVFQFDGLNDSYLNGQGDLVLVTANGIVVQKQPYLYQEINGFRRTVSGYYVLRGNGRVGFEVGSYDTNFPLIIARR